MEGEYLHILGRDSDINNVGGQKVHSSEVEAVILKCEEVEDAIVYGEPYLITEKIVCADVKLRPGVDDRQAHIFVKRFCRRRLDAFKVPVKIQFVADVPHTGRLKRMRRRPVPAGASSDQTQPPANPSVGAALG